MPQTVAITQDVNLLIGPLTTTVSDLLDFFISKGISTNQIEIESLYDLTSDHTPVLLTLSTSFIKRHQKQNLTTKYTDWNKFRVKLDSLIKSNVRLKVKKTLRHKLKIL